MLRGVTTVSFWAADLAAARQWYSELLGVEPYFERPGYKDALAREGVRLGIGFHSRISETGIGNQLRNITATVEGEHLSRWSADQAAKQAGGFAELVRNESTDHS